MNTQVSTPSWWRRLLKRAKSIGQPSVVHVVTHSDKGLRIDASFADGKVITTELHWAEATDAVAFKRDCWTVDLISIGFGNGKASVEINEEMPEWNNIVEALPRYLPGCMPQHAWFLQAAFPAFETNPVPIFRRDAKTS